MANLDIEGIKARIDELKQKKAQAEGQKKAIEDSWKRDYNVSSIEEAEELKAKIEKELEENRAAQEEYLTAADELLTSAGV
ncbi:MAG: hypothetical protein IK038_02835 [Bacteroidaceae bacterium]|nr:hypothetical protein [Bacteroidaceae bacterium]